MKTIAKRVSRRQRRESVLAALHLENEPLTARELARLLGIKDNSYSDLARQLNSMVEAGDLSARLETAEERMLRAGSDVPLAASRATLYSHKPRVPARTRPSLYDDLRPTNTGLPESVMRRPRAENEKQHAENLGLIVDAVQAMAPQPITAAEMSSLTGLNETTARNLMKKLVKLEQLDEVVLPRGGRLIFAVTDLDEFGTGNDFEEALAPPMPKLAALMNEPNPFCDEPAPSKPEVHTAADRDETPSLSEEPYVLIDEFVNFGYRMQAALKAASNERSRTESMSAKLREKDRTITRLSDKVKGLEQQIAEYQKRVDRLAEAFGLSK